MEGSHGSRARHWLILFLSYGVAGVCLYWVFHGLSLAELLRSMVGIDWRWVALSLVLNFSVYVCTGWEWQLLLQPVGRLSFGRAFQAVFASRFANDALPVHAGYVVRIGLTCRALGSSVAPVVSSLLIERIFDVFWLVLGIGLTTLFFPLPSEVARAGDILGGGLVASLALIAWLVLKPHRTTEPPSHGWLSRWRFVARVRLFLDRLAQGIRSVGTSGVALAALGLSVAKLALFCAAFLLLLKAYGFSLPTWVSLAVFLIAYAGISMPSTPAGIGVFQLVCAAGLRFFGVPRAAASSFSLLAYVALTAPLTIAGFFAAAHSGLTLARIRREWAGWKGTKR